MFESLWPKGIANNLSMSPAESMFWFQEDHEDPRVCTVQIMGVEIMSYQDQSLMASAVSFSRRCVHALEAQDISFDSAAGPWVLVQGQSCKFTRVLDGYKKKVFGLVAPSYIQKKPGFQMTSLFFLCLADFAEVPRNICIDTPKVSCPAFFCIFGWMISRCAMVSTEPLWSIHRNQRIWTRLNKHDGYDHHISSCDHGPEGKL